MTILYHIGKAYFVENYVVDIKLRRKFNARLLRICLKNMFTGKYGNARGHLAMVMEWIYVKGLLPKREKR